MAVTRRRWKRYALGLRTSFTSLWNGSTSSHLWKLRYRVIRPSRKKKCKECPWSCACRSWSNLYGTIVMREEIKKISYRGTPSTLPVVHEAHHTVWPHLRPADILAIMSRLARFPSRNLYNHEPDPQISRAFRPRPYPWGASWLWVSNLSTPCSHRRRSPFFRYGGSASDYSW